MQNQDDFLNLKTDGVEYVAQPTDKLHQLCNSIDQYEISSILGELSSDTIASGSDVQVPPRNSLCHIERNSQDINNTNGISQTAFSTLVQTSNDKIHSKMENWDQDV